MEGMRARHYEPLEHKGRVGRIDYKLRSSAALKHNPTLPWGTMNTREILNTKGKRSLEYGVRGFGSLLAGGADQRELCVVSFFF